MSGNSDESNTEGKKLKLPGEGDEKNVIRIGESGKDELEMREEKGKNGTENVDKGNDELEIQERGDDEDLFEVSE